MTLGLDRDDSRCCDLQCHSGPTVNFGMQEVRDGGTVTRLIIGSEPEYCFSVPCAPCLLRYTSLFRYVVI